MPVLTLLRELEKHRRVRYLAVEDGRGSLVLQSTTAP
jgi:hypothetical protein